MKYSDLRDFITQLEKLGQLKRISQPISTHLMMTEISDRTLRAGGPALLFENPVGHSIPVLTNLFGTPERVALAMGRDNVSALREVGKLLATLKEPEPPKGFRDALDKLPVYKQVLNMPVKVIKKAPCQQIIIEGDDVDLTKYPIQSCWPGDVAPLITWGLTVTKGPHKTRQNLGIYRQQLIGKNKVIMRWLSHRGGALDFQEFKTMLNQATKYIIDNKGEEVISERHQKDFKKQEVQNTIDEPASTESFTDVKFEDI